MKRLILSMVVAITLLFPAVSLSQDLDGIIASAIKARGGQEKLKSIETIEESVSMSMMGMEIPVKLTMKRPNMLRQDADAGGMQFVTAYDGSIGWTLNPMMSAQPEKLSDTQLMDIRMQSFIDGPFVSFEEMGLKPSYAGEITEGDQKLHRIDFTSADGSVMSVFLDANTFLESKIERDVMDPNEGKIRVEMVMSDYRDVNGVPFPYKIVQKAGGQVRGEMVVNDIKINQPVEDKVFAYPGN